MTDTIKKTSAPKHKTIKVSFDQDGMRLDRMLSQEFETASFAKVQQLCKKGFIKVDGKKVKSNIRVEHTQEVSVPPSLSGDYGDSNDSRDGNNAKSDKDKQAKGTGKKDTSVRKRGLPPLQLTKQARHEVRNWIIHEEENLLVINKPHGIPVQAGSGHNKSVDRMLEAYFLEDENCQPKLVHRLDKDTSGCLLIAKNRRTASELSKLFRYRDMQKTYWAVVKGRLRNKSGTIKSYLGKQEVEGMEKIVDSDEQLEDSAGNPQTHMKLAETAYETMDSASDYHWLEVTPKTGRMHQIRVHLASLEVPIVNDIKYGGEKFISDDKIIGNKLFLHAHEISYTDNNGETRNFTAPPSPHFVNLFNLLNWEY